MSTFRDLQDRIALDYLNRYDLLPAVKRAIINAVKCYEAERYWFNQTATSTTTTANTTYIGVPSDMIAYDRLEITYSGASTRLLEEDFSKLRAMNAVTAVAVPTHFSYRGDRFELFSVPDSAYTVTCYYLHSLPTLSADADTNAWTNEGANLIVHAATLDVLTNTINSPDQMKRAAHTNSLHMAQKELNLRNSLRLTRRLTSTQF